MTNSLRLAMYFMLYVSSDADTNAITLTLEGKRVHSIPQIVRNIKLELVDQLKLPFHKIRTLSGYAFRKYNSLNLFIAKSNQLRYVSPCAFYDVELVVLDLSVNKLGCVPDFGAIHLSLESLALNNNEISHDCSENIHGQIEFKRLTTLTLKKNLLPRLPSIVLMAKQLHHLDLSYNKITSLPADMTQLLPGLWEFWANKNPLCCCSRELLKMDIFRCHRDPRMENLDCSKHQEPIKEYNFTNAEACGRDSTVIYTTREATNSFPDNTYFTTHYRKELLHYSEMSDIQFFIMPLTKDDAATTFTPSQVIIMLMIAMLSLK